MKKLLFLFLMIVPVIMATAQFSDDDPFLLNDGYGFNHVVDNDDTYNDPGCRTAQCTNGVGSYSFPSAVYLTLDLSDAEDEWNPFDIEEVLILANFEWTITNLNTGASETCRVGEEGSSGTASYMRSYNGGPSIPFYSPPASIISGCGGQESFEIKVKFSYAELENDDADDPYWDLYSNEHPLEYSNNMKWNGEVLPVEDDDLWNAFMLGFVGWDYNEYGIDFDTEEFSFIITLNKKPCAPQVNLVPKICGDGPWKICPDNFCDNYNMLISYPPGLSGGVFDENGCFELVETGDFAGGELRIKYFAGSCASDETVIRLEECGTLKVTNKIMGCDGLCDYTFTYQGYDAPFTWDYQNDAYEHGDITSDCYTDPYTGLTTCTYYVKNHDCGDDFSLYVKDAKGNVASSYVNPTAMSYVRASAEWYEPYTMIWFDQEASSGNGCQAVLYFYGAQGTDFDEFTVTVKDQNGAIVKQDLKENERITLGPGNYTFEYTSAGGCNYTKQVSIPASGIVPVDPHDPGVTIGVLPNPANVMTNIRIKIPAPGEVRVTVVNPINYQPVFTKNLGFVQANTIDVPVDLSAVMPGNYQVIAVYNQMPHYATLIKY